MKEKLIWAYTPEAKAKLAAGYRPPKTEPCDCPKMKKAKAQAARVVAEIAVEKAEAEPPAFPAAENTEPTGE
jgi:hypothetical protein